MKYRVTFVFDKRDPVTLKWVDVFSFAIDFAGSFRKYAEFREKIQKCNPDLKVTTIFEDECKSNYKIRYENYLRLRDSRPNEDEGLPF